ncbi:MAG TPA: RDD family protein [Candidatus Dormibacteraeota bacterium]|nr:RDD family protein [Candidatus Dormibacteraeota bacterium]
MTQDAPPQPPPPHGGPYAPPPHGPPPAYPYQGYGYAMPRPGPAPGLQYAGFWIRFLAYLIDGIVLWIPLGIIFALTIAPTVQPINCTFINTTGFQSATCSGIGPLVGAFGIFWLIGLIVPAVYDVVLWSWLGQTLGQKALGLHVVDANTGTRISVGRAIGRYIGLLVSSWVLFLGLIWAGFDPRKQGWHDKMASTFVVRPL